MTFAAAASAQSANQQRLLRTRVNDTTLLLSSGPIGFSRAALAREIATAVSAFGGPRMLPIPSSGGIDNLRDLLYLRGVDLALVSQNVLTNANTEKELGEHLPDRLAYIARLYNEELHVLAGRSVSSLHDLAGRKIVTLTGDGEAQFTADDLFPRLGLNVTRTAMNLPDALDAVRIGQVAALLVIGGKPLSMLTSLPKDGSLRLLALPIAGATGESYSPAAFRPEDYPQLIPPGQVIDTLAIGTLLVAAPGRRNDETAARLTRFVPVFLNAVSDLALHNRHPKWREVNLAAPLAHYTRHAAAEDWLSKARSQQTGSLQRTFEQFLRSNRQASGAAKLTPEQEKALFDEFLAWSRRTVGSSSPDARR